MDRNFERVFRESMTSVEGGLRLTQDYMSYYGYHRLKTDLSPQQRKSILYYSVWKRFGLDRLQEEHHVITKYLFMSFVLFNINLIPAVNHALNALLPETFPELTLDPEVTTQMVKHLDSYLIWREFGEDHMLKVLEANLMLEKLDLATRRPFGEESVTQWLNHRNEDKYAIKPTL